MPSRTDPAVRSSRWPLTWRWTAFLVLLALVFALLRLVHAAAVPPDDTAVFTERVVVVGVEGRYGLTDADRAVLAANLDNAQVAAVSVRGRVAGACAAAGWTTLGSGRRAGVGSLCTPTVSDLRVTDWRARLAAAAAARGDARPGTLADSFGGCVAAVGPGAAVAAARSDGSLAAYATPAEFRRAGARTSCPLTLVDPGPEADALIAQLAVQRDVTLFVTGVGPAAGSDDPGLQVLYRVGTTLPGWLTATTTRRTGLVTLADLTRTLIDFGQRNTPGATPPAIDGAPLQVEPAALTVPGVERHLRGIAALSDSAVTGYLTLGVVGSLLFVLLVAGLVTGRRRITWVILTFGSVLGAAMMLTGAVRWDETDRPGLTVGIVVLGWGAVLTAVAYGVSRALRVPTAVAGAALTVAAFTADAALGGALQPGSLLNSRPVAGARWYGFGNLTFSVYATAGLVLAGYLAHRFRRSGRPVAAVVAAAAVTLGIVVCEGWPSMGTDFGGVISLTPGALWLLLVLSGVRVTWARVLAVGAAGVVAISLISYLDWRRGPAARSHLGSFVQRVLDGDAVDIVSRKGVTAYETIASVGGIVSVVLGVVLWLLMFRRILPVLEPDFSTLRPVAVAVLATAILGTALNDGGVYVWLTVTASFSVAVGALWVERAVGRGRLDWVGRANR